MLSRIAAVEGHYSRARALYEVIELHQKLQAQPQHAPAAPARLADAGAAPLVWPKIALFNPKYRPAQFMRKTPASNRRRSIALDSRLDHGDQADVPPWKRMSHVDFPAVEAIPGTQALERPFLADRVYARPQAAIPDVDPGRPAPVQTSPDGVPLSARMIQKQKNDAQRQRGQFLHLHSELAHVDEHSLRVERRPLAA